MPEISLIRRSTGEVVATADLEVVSQGPVASFTYSPDLPVAGQPVVFDGSLSQRAVEWHWDDAVSLENPVEVGTWPLDTGETGTFTWNIPATRVPRLTVVDAFGQTDSYAVEIEIVESVPEPEPDPEPEPEPEPGQVVLSTSVQGQGSVSLNPPGGAYDLGTSVTATANAGNGWIFSLWQVSYDGINETQYANPITGTMQGDVSLLAVFIEQSQQPDPVPGEWPSASSTGTSGNLSPSGGITTTSNGQIIQNLDISGTVTVRHTGVIIRNCRIRHSGDYGITDSSTGGIGPVVIENCEIIGTSDNASIGVYVRSPYISRCHIHSQRVGIQCREGGRIVDNYIVNQRVTSGSHNNAVSCHGGSNVLIENNYLEGSTSAALALYPRLSAIQSVDVLNNLFVGVNANYGYGVYAGYTSNHQYRDQNRNIRFIGNRWTGTFGYGAVSAWNGSQPGNVWRDNAWLNGQPI